MSSNSLNNTFDAILAKKTQELLHILENAKNKKNDKEHVEQSSQPDTTNTINYSVKTTLYKINAEQERKIRASKAFKKKEQLFNV